MSHVSVSRANPCDNYLLHDLRRKEAKVLHYCTIPPIARALLCYLRNGLMRLPMFTHLGRLASTVEPRCDRLR